MLPASVLRLPERQDNSRLRSISPPSAMPYLLPSDRLRCCRTRRWRMTRSSWRCAGIELESGRVMQAQILFLKGQDLLPYRDAVNTAVESRHLQVRKLWRETLAGIGVTEKAA
jgi:hypothetical protein